MLPLVKVFMAPKEELMPALESVLYSGQLAEGEAVYEFERAFSEKFKIPTVLAVSSGTAALHISLALAGVTPGDEVISTPMTAEPTNTSVLYCGARVVWADVCPETGPIDPQSVKNSITPKTKAIIAVHYAGYPVQLDALRKIADEYGIALIEDCAHALGATYGDSQVGTVGDFGIFSFQAIKHMTTVDGGMLAIRDPSKIVAAKKMRWFGMLKGVPRTEVDITGVGYKYNMNNVTAMIGLVQMRAIDAVLSSHKENGRAFDAAFTTMPGVGFANSVGGAESSYWLYTLLSDRSDKIAQDLNVNEIAASKLHRPNNLHSIFKQSDKPLPGLDKFYSRLLHIPCGWWVSAADRGRIINIIGNA